MAAHIPHVPATFIHVPKTAGTSFRIWLQNVPHIGRFDTHCTKKDAEQMWPNLGITFSFVRNPWDRMVSYFHFIGQRSEDRVIANKPEQNDLEVVELYRQGFKNWIRLIYNRVPNVYDMPLGSVHRRDFPQLHWTRGVDLIFKVENLDTEFHQIQKMIGCYAPLPRTNTSRRSFYRDYYDDESRQMVAKIFAQDIEELQYAF